MKFEIFKKKLQPKYFALINFFFFEIIKNKIEKI